LKLTLEPKVKTDCRGSGDAGVGYDHGERKIPDREGTQIRGEPQIDKLSKPHRMREDLIKFTALLKIPKEA
jgi:hypothetical protein